MISQSDFDWNADAETSIQSTTPTTYVFSIHLLKQLAEKISDYAFAMS